MKKKCQTSFKAGRFCITNFLYSQVSIKQASSLNYFQEIFHPARSYQSPARLTIFDKKIQICFLYSFLQCFDTICLLLLPNIARFMIKTMIFRSFTRKKCLLLENKAMQFPPCLLNVACLLNYFSKIFHPACLMQPVRLIET